MTCIQASNHQSQRSWNLTPLLSKAPQHATQTKMSFFAPLTKAREEQITDSMVRWIAKDGMPVYTASKSGFLEFMHTIERQYTVPHSSTIWKKISLLYDKTFNEVKACVNRSVVENNCPYALTTDCWTSNTGTADPYISVTLHRWELGVIS